MDIISRFRILGVFLLVVGVGIAAGGFLYGLPLAQGGLASAQEMYEAQGVELSYNEEGQLVDRGTTEGAAAIMALLVDEWKFPVDHANFDPADPLVDTRDELMYYYAIITYHVLHGEVDVTLTAEQVPITYRDVTYTGPGVYPIAPLAYYAELDRAHPIESQLRGAWSPLAIGLVGSLAAGHANQAAGELAVAVSVGIGALGLLFAASGAGFVWVSFAPKATMRARGRGVPAAVAAVFRK